MAVPKSAKALRAALRQYVRHPGRSTLRVYLRRKARRGHFDQRMFDWYRVAGNVNAACRRAVARAYWRGLVPTSTTGGRHAPGSYHYPVGGVGRAVDCGLIESEIGTRKGMRRMKRYQRAEFRAWRRGKRPRMRELIGPINGMVVLGGRHVRLAEGAALEDQHDNHVHQAFV